MSQSQKNIKKGGPKKKKPKILKKKKLSNKKPLQIEDAKPQLSKKNTGKILNILDKLPLPHQDYEKLLNLEDNIPKGIQSWSRLKDVLKSAPGQKLLDEVRTPESDQLEKVNIKQRTATLVDAVRDHFEGNKGGGKDTKKTKGLISKIEKEITKLPDKIIHTLRHPCSLKIPLIKIPLLHQPKICGHKPTAIIKNIGKEILNPFRAIKMLTSTFTWPVDGKCPYSQKGGRLTKRRRSKKHHTRRRRKTRRRRTKKRKTRRRKRRRKKRKTRRRR